MTRYAAFLRGVNLGRRTVKNAELKAAFAALGYDNVQTLLASGNVLFDARADKGIREKVEAGLKQQFGFEVPIVLRPLDALRRMAAANPFGRVAGADAQLHVLFVDPPLPEGYHPDGRAGDYDVAQVSGGEIFFIVYRKDDGTYLGSSKLLPDKVVPTGSIATMRNWNTILKAIA